MEEFFWISQILLFVHCRHSTWSIVQEMLGQFTYKTSENQKFTEVFQSVIFEQLSIVQIRRQLPSLFVIFHSEKKRLRRIFFLFAGDEVKLYGLKVLNHLNLIIFAEINSLKFPENQADFVKILYLHSQINLIPVETSESQLLFDIFR